LCIQTKPAFRPAMPPSMDPEEKQALNSSNHLLKDDSEYSEQPDKPQVNKNSGADFLLSKIYDLLDTRVRSDAEEREKAEADEGIKNDWMLAAAVVDRFLFLTFGSLFVGGTFVFFAIFSFTP